MLLETFNIVNNIRKDTKLIIAGSSHPNYPKYLEKFSLKNTSSTIIYKGYIPEKQLPEIISSSDVVILPYKTCTGTSGVVHLVSSFGIPIIATNHPEFRELLLEGCGLLLSNHDSKSLAIKINEHLFSN